MHERNVEEGTIEWPTGSAHSGSHSRSYHGYEDVYVYTRTICGRDGSIGPEYCLTGKCTLKNDVFAYGKMLLEVISGRPLHVKAGGIWMEDWIDKHMNKYQLGRVIDPNLLGNFVEEEAEGLVQLALLCAHDNPSARPEMSEVAQMLESQFLQRDPSSRSSWSQSENDSTPYYSFPPSPSPQGISP